MTLALVILTELLVLTALWLAIGPLRLWLALEAVGAAAVTWLGYAWHVEPERPWPFRKEQG